MPTADTTEGKAQGCYYLTTRWAHQGAFPPWLLIRVGGRDTEALLDSGRNSLEKCRARTSRWPKSMVTLANIP